MKELKTIKPIEYNNKRVMGSKQLAEFYETSVDQIKNNFNRNKDRYKEGIHFYIVSKADSCWYQIVTNKKYHGTAYVWTEKGALLIAKSLGTDKAWEVYEQLVDLYFRVKEAKLRLDEISRYDLAKMIMESEEEKRALQLQIEQDKPKVQFADDFQAAEGNILVRELAKLIGTGEQRLFQFLFDQNILIKANEPYQRYMDLGWFKMKSGTHKEKGKSVTHRTITVTPKGQYGIWKKWNGIVDQPELGLLEAK